MKSIKLTKKHKFKLLEMCKVSFPELGSVQLGVKERHGWSIDYLVFGIEKSDEETFVIHWFEFCMTHLVENISKKLTNEQCLGMPIYYDESEKIDWNRQSLASVLVQIHPIDYLYEEFKKLKL